MFSLEFGYCSKDRWQFCNFLHKLTGGILVNKHTTFLLFSNIFNSHETPITPNPCSPASPLHRFASSPTPLHLQQPHHHRYRHVSTRSTSPLICHSLLRFTHIHRRETLLYDPPPRLLAPSRGSLPPRRPPLPNSPLSTTLAYTEACTREATWWRWLTGLAPAGWE